MKEQNQTGRLAILSHVSKTFARFGYSSYDVGRSTRKQGFDALCDRVTRLSMIVNIDMNSNASAGLTTSGNDAFGTVIENFEAALLDVADWPSHSELQFFTKAAFLRKAIPETREWPDLSVRLLSSLLVDAERLSSRRETSRPLPIVSDTGEIRV